MIFLYQSRKGSKVEGQALGQRGPGVDNITIIICHEPCQNSVAYNNKYLFLVHKFVGQLAIPVINE